MSTDIPDADYDYLRDHCEARRILSEEQAHAKTREYPAIRRPLSREDKWILASMWAIGLLLVVAGLAFGYLSH